MDGVPTCSRRVSVNNGQHSKHRPVGGEMSSVEDVTREDARAWELLQQQRADAALAAKAAEEFASQARAQVGAAAVALSPARRRNVWFLPCGSRTVWMRSV